MATIPSDGSPMLGEHIFSAEDAAFEKRTLLNILDSIHESILIIDAQTRVCYVNDSYLKMFGIQREKIIGRHLAKFEPLARIHEVLKTGVPLTGDISHIHSAQLDVCADIVPLCQDGRIIGALALMKNMTELVQTNRELEHFKQLSEHLQNELASKDDLPPAFRNVLGHSKSFVTVLRTAARAAPSEASICIMGESGVGKEVVAEALHYSSRRAGGPLIKINCAAIPENLMESELFGYEAGAFTGARAGGKPGKFELAQHGTIFLDEIGEMPLTMQVKLLRALQEHEITRVGGSRPIQLDFRLITATNRDLAAMMSEGSFREDLYYRINVIALTIPPLRERREDIVPLARFFLSRLNKKYNKTKILSYSAIRRLEHYRWPGNVRELRNVIERLFITSPTDILEFESGDNTLSFRGAGPETSLEAQDRTDPASAPVREGVSLRAAVEAYEKQLVLETLDACGGSVSKAAGRLRLHKSVLYRKLEKYRGQEAISGPGT